MLLMSPWWDAGLVANNPLPESRLSFYSPFLGDCAQAPKHESKTPTLQRLADERRAPEAELHESTSASARDVL